MSGYASDQRTPASKRRRGPYKMYLLSPNQEVPESTLRNTGKSSGNKAPAESLGDKPPLNESSSSSGEETAIRSSYDEDMQQDEACDENRDDGVSLTSGQDVERMDSSSDMSDDMAMQQDETIIDQDTDEDQDSDVASRHDLLEGSSDQLDNLLDPENELPAGIKRSSQDSQKTIDRYDLNGRLHKDFNTTRLEALLMILHLAFRHSNTQAFVEDQITFVNSLFDANVLDVSYHIYQRVFQSSATLVRHFFCPACEVSVGSQSDIPNNTKFVKCPKCNKDIDVRSVDSGNYFINLSLKDQMECILNRPDVQLVDKETRMRPEGLYDIFDGSIYKCCSQPECPLANKNALTVTFNTDGAKVFESTKNSLWPIQLHLNELIPEQRFKSENLILGGLWFGRSAPNMALFLKPFLEELYELSKPSVQVKQASGEIVTCPVFVLGCSLDAVSKCKVVCMKQFNGMFGCLYCLHPNNVGIPSEDGTTNRLLRHYDTSQTYPLRTQEDVIHDMFEADTRRRANQLGAKDSVNGILGISVLLVLAKYLKTFSCNTFSIVWSVVIDYLHCVLEGVTCKLAELLETVLSSEELTILSERLQKISPPHDGMTPRPRSIFDKVYWKAKEFRAFLLYYALPCLEDLLPRAHFSNLKLISRACYILLSDNISIANLQEAQKNLELFVVGFQKLYGLKNVTYNLHLCTHLVELVRRMGPLWAYSNFIFESGNGHLVKLVQGTRSVINEIAVKFCTLQSVSTIVSNNPINEKALNFCNDVMSFRYSKTGKKFDDVSVTGPHSFVSVNPAEENLLKNYDVFTNNKIKMYHRAIKKGILYTSKSYCEGHVFDDSCVQLMTGTYAVVDKIVCTTNNKLMCVIKPINIAPNYLLPNIKRCCSDVYGDVKVVPFDDISRKSVLVSVGIKNFVCDIPNFYEKD